MLVDMADYRRCVTSRGSANLPMGELVCDVGVTMSERGKLQHQGRRSRLVCGGWMLVAGHVRGIVVVEVLIRGGTVDNHRTLVDRGECPAIRRKSHGDAFHVW